jgi:FkbM family methyltransferase
MMISYAQNFEDVVLARAFAGRTNGFYIDVGAMDPVDASVTKHFYEMGWHGINVEPVARFHKALVRERHRDINLCVALGAKRETLTFIDFEAKGISTLSTEFAEHFIRQGYQCKRRPVEVVPLREICEAHCRGPIDFMKIDVEGHERAVLEGGDWRRFRPRVLLLEAIMPNSNEPHWHNWEPFVLQQDYLFAYFDGLNRFYVSREEEMLLAHFQLPPNALDQFVTSETARLRERLSLYEDRLTPRSVLQILLRRLFQRQPGGLR